MKTKRQKSDTLYLQVGIFFTLGMTLTFLAIFLLGSKKGLFTDQYTVYTYFNDISGLRVGSPVRLAGIKVGVVSEISFEEYAGEVSEDEEEDAKIESEQESQTAGVVKVKLGMELNRIYQDRICTDSQASVVNEGLLGDRLVFITVGCRKIASLDDTTKQPTPLQNGDILVKSFEPAGFGTLVEQGDVLMRDAQSLVKNTDQLITGLNNLIHEINEGDGMMNKLIYDKTLAQSLDRLESSMNNLDRTTRNLNNITNKIDEGEGTVGALLNDASLYHEIKMLLGKANRNKLIKSVIRYTVKTKEKDQLK